MTYNKKILLSIYKIRFLNNAINNLINNNKFSFEYIHEYINYYNKLIRFISGCVKNHNIQYKNVKKISKSFSYISEINSPINIYEYKIINKITNNIINNKLKKPYIYEYVDGLDTFIYRQKNKQCDKLIMCIYPSSYNGLKRKRVYDILQNIETFNHEFYFYIYKIFYNNNILYMRGFLTYEETESYKMEKMYILLKNNKKINKKLQFKYLHIYNFNNELVNIESINNSIVTKLNKISNNLDNYIIYINDRKHFIYLNYKEVYICNKKIINDRVVLYYDINKTLSFKKIYPVLYYDIDDKIQIYKNNNKILFYTNDVNESTTFNIIPDNISIDKIFTHNYILYVTDSDFIKILIIYNIYNKNYDILKKIKIDMNNESIETGFEKLLKYKKYLYMNDIQNEYPIHVLYKINKDALINIKFENYIKYNIYNDKFEYIDEQFDISNNFIEKYNSIYKFLK
jgi:hypothetical protein